MEEVSEHDIHHHHEGNSISIVIGAILLLLALFLLVYYLIPALRGSGTQFNIPGRIDINLHQIR